MGLNKCYFRPLRRLFFRKTIKTIQTPPEDAKESKPDEEEFVILEGKRLISEAIHLGINPLVVATSRISLLQGLPLEKVTNKEKIKMFLVPYNTLSTWSDLTTSPGFMAAFKKSDITDVAHNRKNGSFLPITVVLDNVRNPDNFGGILRLAAASGCDTIIATPGCANAWQPKVIRAAAGTHFHVNLRVKIPWYEMEQFLPPKRQVVICNMHEESLSGQNIFDQVEISKLVSECQSFRCTDPKTSKQYDYSFNDDNLVEKFSNAQLQQIPITEFQNHGQHLVIVIGGEN